MSRSEASARQRTPLDPMNVPTSAARLLLAPGVPDAVALGARSGADLLLAPLGPTTSESAAGGDAGAPALEEAARAELLERDAASELWRLPLPGTPGPDGHLRGRPRGAGTGFVLVRRYRRLPLVAALRARFTPPRSESLAEREWNLLCHLRAHGVGTSEPLAVGALGASPLARRSVLVVRELEGMVSLDRWLARVVDPTERACAARALGLALARLSAAGVRLPRLDPAHIVVSLEGSADGDACAAHDLAELAECARVRRTAGGLRLRRLPEVALTDVRAGRVGPPPTPRERARLLARLTRDLSTLGVSIGGAVPVRLGSTAGPRASVSPREALRVAHLALLRDLPRHRRRALVARLERVVAARRAPRSEPAG